MWYQGVRFFSSSQIFHTWSEFVSIRSNLHSSPQVLPSQCSAQFGHLIASPVVHSGQLQMKLSLLLQIQSHAHC